MSLPARGGQFSITIVRLAVDLVLHAGATIRGVASCLSLMVSRLGLDFPAPSFGAVRSWLLRIGCYALCRPLPRDTPWFWLMDHTIQIGSQKLLVIAGCPLADVPFGERPLRISDLTLLALVPMDHSTGKLVDVEMEKVVIRTGVPRVIVSDEGSDLNNGVALFQQRHPQTVHVHDAAHQAANVLKNRWEKDERWLAFVQRLPQVAAKLRQTKEAYLLPPALRTKARFMNVGPLLRFAERVLGLLDKPSPSPKVVEKYGWLGEYRGALAEWRCEYEIAQTVIKHVRLHGVNRESVATLEADWSKLGEATALPGARDVMARMRSFVRKEGELANPCERLPGSTEVLESAFGKLKRLEQSQSGGGFTGLVLTLGTMMSTTEEEDIREGLDAVPKKEAEGKVKRMFGATMQWLRRRFMNGEECVPNPG